MFIEGLIGIYSESVFCSGSLKTANNKHFTVLGLTSWSVAHFILKELCPILTTVMVDLAHHEFEIFKTRGTKHDRQFLRPVFARSMRCLWMPGIFTPAREYNVPLDHVSICGSGCFSQSPQVIYFRLLWASMCEENWDHLYAGFMCAEPLKMVKVSQHGNDLQTGINKKYCIFGWLTSLFNLESGPTPSTQAQTHTLTVGGKLKIIIHLVETSPLASCVCVNLKPWNTHSSQILLCD